MAVSLEQGLTAHKSTSETPLFKLFNPEDHCELSEHKHSMQLSVLRQYKSPVSRWRMYFQAIGLKSRMWEGEILDLCDVIEISVGHTYTMCERESVALKERQIIKASYEAVRNVRIYEVIWNFRIKVDKCGRSDNTGRFKTTHISLLTSGLLNSFCAVGNPWDLKVPDDVYLVSCRPEIKKQ